MGWFDDLQRQSMSSEAALASSQVRALVDASPAAGRVSARSLSLHADGDRTVPFEEGRRLAGLIPGSRFVSLHSQNHLLLEDEPAWPQFLEEVLRFAGASPVGSTSSPVTLRELEVLRLVAHGCSNEQIGSRLALSVRTVERHLSNVYVKLSVSGKSARAAAVGRLRELEDGSVWR
jgi:DNA-binding CsgD family transcriptional regulator